MRMRYKNERGIALIFSLLVIAVLLIIGCIFIFRTISEKGFADRERFAAQAFYAAEGGAHEALNELDTLINTDMMDTVNDANPQVVAQYAALYTANGDGLGFLALAVRREGVAQLVLDGLECSYSGVPTDFGSGTYRYDITITEKNDPQIITVDMWDFPYLYRIESIGTVGGVSQQVVLTGDFTVRVQRDNFAKFALFTDNHRLESGTTVWFTDKTNFAGPLHTNDRYSFALNPSGIFYGHVTQAELRARFYDNGSPILRDADANAPRDVPTFHAGFDRNVEEIDLQSSVVEQDLIDQARAGDTTPGNGIFVANNGAEVTGGIYVNGNCTLTMGVDAGDHAYYVVTQGGATKIITVDDDTGSTTVETVGIGVETFAGVPDGVDDLGTIICVDGAISSLAGTVQQDTELTVASSSDVVITDHIMYSDYTAAIGSPGDVDYVPPHADGTANVLGVVSWGGDVRIGTTAPDNINIHSTIMARDGIFAVDEYSNTGVGPRGTATILGGVISEYYGAFGLFNGSTGQQVAGYGRNFVYDGRMAVGKSPPYFPSMRTFIAFTNDITDTMVWQGGN